VSGFLGGGGGGAVACGREEGSARSTMGERSRGDAYYEEEGAREMVGCGGKERVERHWRHSHVGPPRTGGSIGRCKKRTMGSEGSRLIVSYYLLVCSQ
jgi:hypothetical protein